MREFKGRVVTPGTVIESNLLEEKKNNYIMSIYKTGIYYGLGVCDVSTGDFYATQICENNNFSKLLDEISRYSPSEIIVNKMMFETKSEISKIKDRFDLTLECIRRYYNNEDSPLSEVINKDKQFFDLFVDFKGYVNYFYLQDLVSEDYSAINYFGKPDELIANPLPKTVDDYLQFIDNELVFVEARNARIAKESTKNEG